MVDLRPFYRTLAPATRSSYKAAWRAYLQFCDQVGIDPLRCNVPTAQAWVDSMIHQGRTAAFIQRQIIGVRNHLEYHAMMAARPYEPFGAVTAPKGVPRTRPLALHEALDDERVARALYDSRNDARAHGILWACAGMGLSKRDLQGVTPERLKWIGGKLVAIVPRRARAHLVPVPRELALCIDAAGWPVANLAAQRVKPYVVTSTKDLRDFHRDCALRLGLDERRVYESMNDGANPKQWEATDRTRFAFSSHPAMIVSAHLRQLLIDISNQ